MWAYTFFRFQMVWRTGSRALREIKKCYTQNIEFIVNPNNTQRMTVYDKEFLNCIVDSCLIVV